eukprot:TRINITY_DN3212_c1_g1_i6.p2 TRINITY_DN3212_c1_g1~~TRINITY_DN3212_c1_g1_i6.p2  ORF type:complete len:361 (+),score=35.42 TRINITY_DN3212_c1_g1_i6:65-1147(+)
MRQLLQAVAYTHELKLTHTDLKPENILLVNDSYNKEEREEGSRIGTRVPRVDQVKVIDFGSATFEEDYHSTVVQTRHYRAPEVILGLGWSFPCDIWSVGCIFYELIVGETLFQTRDNLEHLAMMEKVLGRIPEIMVRNCSESARKYFNKSNYLEWPPREQYSHSREHGSKKSTNSVRKLRQLKEQLRAQGDKSFYPHLDMICDLMLRMLRYDPAHRMTAKEALKYEFFQIDFQSDNDNKQSYRNGEYIGSETPGRTTPQLPRKIRSEVVRTYPREEGDENLREDQDKQQKEKDEKESSISGEEHESSKHQTSQVDGDSEMVKADVDTKKQDEQGDEIQNVEDQVQEQSEKGNREEVVDIN